MKDNGLKQKKAEALYSVFKDGLNKGCFDSLFGAGRYCATHPAPCYFISAKRASLLLGRLQRGDILKDLHPSTRRMALELWRNYKKYLEERPDNTLSRERILEVLVEEPAPEFFISADAVRKILRQEIKRARRKRK